MTRRRRKRSDNRRGAPLRAAGATRAVASLLPSAPVSEPPRKPAVRRLRAYAYDPSLGLQLETAVLNHTVIKVPWEEGTEGPIGDAVEVIDVDPASGCAYAPVNLNSVQALAEDGLPPSEGNPQFHQQMVYAVAMTTVTAFERALGRRALWAPRFVREPRTGRLREEFVPRLRIYPHALREANAYYSPDKKALLFGYFPADASADPGNIPGGMVFTCLSHDIVAHETTHALLHGLHRRFVEPSNPDVLAFHEAFADIVALFQHFTYPEALKHQIARTRGDLARQNLLGELALQFGQAIGNHGALRSALGRYDAEGRWVPEVPDPMALERETEPHARGAILVGAVFDAFLSIYKSRIVDLLRIATGGTGVLPQGEIHPDLVNRLANEAAKSAEHVLLMCIRALDYCPPVDITFGDYLRALITADTDLVPADERRYRVSVIEAFRRRGIYPRDVRTLSEDGLRWQGPSAAHRELLQRVLPTTNELNRLRLTWKLTSNRREIFEMNRANGARVAGWLKSVREWAPEQAAAVGRLLGLDLVNPERKVEVHSVRPTRRVGPDGQQLVDVIVEITQWRPGYLDDAVQRAADAGPGRGRRSTLPPHDFAFRGGCTLVISLETGGVRYAVVKDISSQRRLAREREHRSGRGSLHETYLAARGLSPNEPFALLHRRTV